MTRGEPRVWMGHTTRGGSKLNNRGSRCRMTGLGSRRHQEGKKLLRELARCRIVGASIGQFSHVCSSLLLGV